VNLSFKPKTFAAMLAVCAEPDLSFALIDIEARNTVAAVAAGWAAFDPGFMRPLDVELPQRPRNGWEDRHSFRYQTSENEKLTAGNLPVVSGSSGSTSAANFIILCAVGAEDCLLL
jgi:hypothetical protein